eukprot:403365355
MEKSEKEQLLLKKAINAEKKYRTIGEFTIDFQKFLGTGKYGQVYPAFKTSQQNGKRYACKIIDLKNPDDEQNQLKNEIIKNNEQGQVPNEQQNIKSPFLQNCPPPQTIEHQRKVYNYLKEKFVQEIELLQLVKSKHTMQMYKAYKGKQRYYLISELCNGGDLQLLMTVRKQLPENQAKAIIKQIVIGLNDMHNSSIAHRDLKLANVLLEFPDQPDLINFSREEKQQFLLKFDFSKDNFAVKISDFGFARIILPEQNNRKKTVCGTPKYMDPNLLLNQDSHYSQKIDIWSLGILFYEMITGFSPFYETKSDLFKDQMRKGMYEYRSFFHISPEAIHFISLCLQRNEKFRASADDLINHQIFQEQSTSQLFGMRENFQDIFFSNQNVEESEILKVRNDIELSTDEQYTLDQIQNLLFQQSEESSLYVENDYRLKRFQTTELLTQGSLENLYEPDIINTYFRSEVQFEEHKSRGAQYQKRSYISKTQISDSSNLIQKKVDNSQLNKLVTEDEYFSPLQHKKSNRRTRQLENLERYE